MAYYLVASLECSQKVIFRRNLFWRFNINPPPCTVMPPNNSGTLLPNTRENYFLPEAYDNLVCTLFFHILSIDHISVCTTRILDHCY